jgi:uncharacterized protein YoxC
MISISHLIDAGFIIIALLLLWELHKVSTILDEVAISFVDLAEKHNTLAQMTQEFSDAVMDDLEEVERVLNEELDND